jgi:phospholipid transport system substrate-binding protein
MTMPLSFAARLSRSFATLFLGLGLIAVSQAKPDPHGAPDKFVEAAAHEALTAIKADPSLKAGNLNAVNKAVDTYILPYVDFIKTTRLAAALYWRQATPDQQTRLADAFRGTLVRTYSGALANVDQNTRITILPFRGDISVKDLVIRSTVSRSDGGTVRVDYRLENTPQHGWKIYDINVEDVWLINNYRNQFARAIQSKGIDSLINDLNTPPKKP